MQLWIIFVTGNLQLKLSIISHCANDQLDIGGLLYSDRLKFTGGITKEVQNDTKENISADGGDTQ